MGGGVVTTGVSDDVDDGVSVEDGENVGVVDVGVGVDVENGVNEDDDGVGVEEQKDPKKVANTVTGTSIVSVAGTVTVVAAPK